MILEPAVLLRVEDFEERRSRIPAEVLSELVDLVEQEERVRRARLLQVRDDLAGKRTDVSPTVAPDFGLVPNSAE